MRRDGSVVMVATPNGIPLVRNPDKPKPLYWKLPGGKSESMETSIDCALRELREETGIDLLPSQLQEIHRERKGDHTLFFFFVSLDCVPQIKEGGDEGEEIKIFSPERIVRMPNFLPSHLVKPVQDKLNEILATAT